jgi:hypothetical protein
MYFSMRTMIIWSLILLLLSGCVGTVQETAQPYTKVNDVPVAPLSFAGITNAVAISDSRIEVFFYPATGGSGRYTYDIIYGDSPYPTSIPSEVLQPDYRGLLRYTLTGLERLSSYVIQVEVRDRETDVPSTSGVSRTVTTFANMVADFNGISSAYNMPGQDGKDSIKVRWTPARISGGLTKQEWDPKAYEIVLVDADRLTPNDMDIASYGPSDGKWIYGVNHENTINEFILRGLPSSKKFYIRMRAIHEGSIEDVYNPKKRSELNTNYVQISTLSANLADINFQPDSFAVALASGEQGLNAVSANWTMATGVFDHYRIYYSQQNGGVSNGNLPDLCLTPLQSPVSATVFCKRAQFSEISAIISGLTAYTSYEFTIILCATSACLSNERIAGPVRTIQTDPTMPSFNGLREIKSASHLDELETLTLKYDPPNFTSGYFDGLVLKMRRTVDGSDQDVEITVNSPNQFHDVYNFLGDNQITVRGISYLTEDPYCFTLFPFKWETDGINKRLFPNGTWKCITPLAEAATSLQFPGLSSGNSSAGVINLAWDAPSAGIFSHYELFWTKNDGASLNWGDAIAQAGNNFNFTNYGRQLIDPIQTSFVLNSLPDGNYSFGIITYYSYMTDSGAVILRSETNSNILQCTVNNSSTETLDCN